jgi:hypothetical protein
MSIGCAVPTVSSPLAPLTAVSANQMVLRGRRSGGEDRVKWLQTSADVAEKKRSSGDGDLHS